MNDVFDPSGGPAAKLSRLQSPALAPSLPAAAEKTISCFVIEDEPGIQNIVSLAAESFGIQAHRFRNAAKAIAALGNIAPSLVFLDVSLEGSDAIDVIRGMAEAGFRGTVQLMSGKDAVTLEEVKRVGERHLLVMRPTLRKPFRLDDVRAILREHKADLAVQTTAPAVFKAPVAKEASRIDLDMALRKKWLEVWYQPKIDLKQMRFAGAEALIRCRHPEKGLLPPSAFLPEADECLMIRLTETVLLTALGDWPKFAQVGFPFKLAVNVPLNVLAKLPIHMIVRDHKPAHEKWPGLLLEITEDQAARDIPLLHEIAIQLRIHNILLAVDDFGTGYSHLARMKELPFAELKLDRSMVTDCGENPNNASLCHAAIDLAHGFGCVAVAEGVEKASELKALVKMGCDLGQGYLFAKPMQRDQLISSLVKHAASAHA